MNDFFAIISSFFFFFRYVIWIMCVSLDIFVLVIGVYWYCIVNILHLMICGYISLFTMHVWLRKKRERGNGNLELLFLLWTAYVIVILDIYWWTSGMMEELGVDVTEALDGFLIRNGKGCYFVTLLFNL